MESQDIEKAWRLFQIESVFARNYGIAHQLDGGVAARNPILKKILPSLLHIKLTAILDEALESQILAQNTTFPKGYRRTLEGCISFLHDSNQIKNGEELHDLRERRNETAHEISASIMWEQLDKDMTEVHKVLQHLNFVGERPNFEIKAERSAMQGSDEPGIAFYCDYSVRVIEGNKVAAEYTWRSSIHDDSA